MSVEIIKSDLKTGSFKSIYFFYGEEEYLKKYYLNELQKKLITAMPEFNYHIFEGKEITPDILSDAIESYPVMADNKLIIIKDLPINAIKGDFGSYLGAAKASFPTYSTLVLYEENFEFDDTRAENDFLAFFDKIGTAIKFQKVNESELVNWVSRHLKHHGHLADNNTIKYMLSITENNMTSLKNEIEKLCSYAVTPEITKAHVDAVITKTIDARIFDMTNAVAKGDYSAAFTVLDELYFLKFDDTVIAANIYWAFINLLKVKISVSCGKQTATISKELGIRDFIVNNNIRLCQRMSEQFIKKCIYHCEKADIDLKFSYGNKRVIIERLLGEILNAQNK
jgi:DNA polymerase-3 subunit delta